ncbi:MAG: trypsin-like serine protease [Pseudomonadota bacterium]
MLRASLLLICSLLLALPAAASESSRKMLSAEYQAGWQAVGRLNVRGQGYCTATLIATDLVLTAAHCVANRRTGRIVKPQAVHFLAGFRNGNYAVHGQASAVLPAEGYFAAGRPISRDLALIKLRQQVPAHLVTPLPLLERTEVGQKVATFSYGRDRSFSLSRETDCRIMGRYGNLLGTTCEATPGVSGAPMVVSTAQGPRIAGVIIAMSGAKPPVLIGRAIAVAADAPARSQLFGNDHQVAGQQTKPLTNAAPVGSNTIIP